MSKADLEKKFVKYLAFSIYWIQLENVTSQYMFFWKSEKKSRKVQSHFSLLFLHFFIMRPHTFEFLNKCGISQITFFDRSRRPIIFLKDSVNSILHILVYKSTYDRKKIFLRIFLRIFLLYNMSLITYVVYIPHTLIIIRTFSTSLNVEKIKYFIYEKICHCYSVNSKISWNVYTPFNFLIYLFILFYFDFTYLDNIFSFTMVMVRHEPNACFLNIIHNVTSQSFLLDGCVKLQHVSNKWRYCFLYPQK